MDDIDHFKAHRESYNVLCIQILKAFQSYCSQNVCRDDVFFFKTFFSKCYICMIFVIHSQIMVTVHTNFIYIEKPWCLPTHPQSPVFLVLLLGYGVLCFKATLIFNRIQKKVWCLVKHLIYQNHDNALWNATDCSYVFTGNICRE